MADIILSTDSPEVRYLCMRDKRLAKLITMVGDIKITPHSDNTYSFLVHEIIEQMLSVKAGKQIFSRLEQLCGGNVTPEKVTMLTDEQIRSTGTSNAKVEYIRNLTMAFSDGLIDEQRFSCMSDDEIIKEMISMRGIGKWTAKMYLMFVLNRPDILPVEDGAFLQVYKWLYKTDDVSPQSVMRKCKKWSPYSTTASRFFYRALDSRLTKSEFHLFK